MGALVALLALPVTTAAADLPSGRTTYRDLIDYEAELRQLAAVRPDRVRLVVIGRSREGRPLTAVEIAAKVARTDDGRPVNLAVGLVHGREWTSGEMVMEHARELALEDPDRLRRVRARTRTLLVPVLNPDGFLRSRTTDPLWRANAAGVDLNRNFGAFWGGPDGSDAPGASTYRGPAPFSEPESRALRDLAARRQVAVVNAVHAFGPSVLHQPGFATTSQPGLPAGAVLPGGRAFRALARRMAGAAGYVANPAYVPRDITGAAEDGLYFNQFASAFTIEVGRVFQPAFAEGVVDEFPRVSAALLRAAEAASDRSTHAVLRGTAEPGAVLRLSRSVRYSTSRVVTGTDTDVPRTGAARRLRQRYTSRLTVPASGRFTWHVNPSQRPLAVLAGRTEAWTLSCRGRERRVVLRRTQVRTIRVRCPATG